MKNYLVSTLVIIFITGFIWLFIINRDEESNKYVRVQVLPPTSLSCSWLTIRSLMYLFLPSVIFGASFYNHAEDGGTKLVVKYIYAISLGLLMCVYAYYTLHMINNYRLNPSKQEVSSPQV